MADEMQLDDHALQMQRDPKGMRDAFLDSLPRNVPSIKRQKRMTSGARARRATEAMDEEERMFYEFSYGETDRNAPPVPRGGKRTASDPLLPNRNTDRVTLETLYSASYAPPVTEWDKPVALLEMITGSRPAETVVNKNTASKMSTFKSMLDKGKIKTNVDEIDTAQRYEDAVPFVSSNYEDAENARVDWSHRVWQLHAIRQQRIAKQMEDMDKADAKSTLTPFRPDEPRHDDAVERAFVANVPDAFFERFQDSEYYFNMYSTVAPLCVSGSATGVDHSEHARTLRTWAEHIYKYGFSMEEFDDESASKGLAENSLMHIVFKILNVDTNAAENKGKMNVFAAFASKNTDAGGGEGDDSDERLENPYASKGVSVAALRNVELGDMTEFYMNPSTTNMGALGHKVATKTMNTATDEEYARRAGQVKTYDTHEAKFRADYEDKVAERREVAEMAVAKFRRDVEKYQTMSENTLISMVTDCIRVHVYARRLDEDEGLLQEKSRYYLFRGYFELLEDELEDE